MIIIFQILFASFVLYVFGSIAKKRKQGMLGVKGLLFWVLFWLGALTVVLWPEALSRLADVFGIGRGVDLAIYISMAVVFFLLLRLHIKIECVGRDITTLTREIALLKHNEK